MIPYGAGGTIAVDSLGITAHPVVLFLPLLMAEVFGNGLALDIHIPAQ
jgi:hypothetical protein